MVILNIMANNKHNNQDILNVFSYIKDLLNIAINNILLSYKINDLNLSDIQYNVEKPKSKDHGDFATNISMLLAKHLKQSPKQVAKYISSHLSNHKDIINVDIAGPGFINITMSQQFWQNTLLTINSSNANRHKSNGESVNIEFVSANPTGPLHIGHTRTAVYGDSLARILKYRGYSLTKEYYINDAGQQTKTLVNSVWIRYQQLLGADIAIPEECYPGEYLIDVAKTLLSHHGDNLLKLQQNEREKIIYEISIASMMKLIKADLRDLGVQHDIFVSEQKDIVDNNLITDSINELKHQNLIYSGTLEKPLGFDDQHWTKQTQLLFKSTSFGDDEDRVIMKNDETFTYFASDIAYHKHKCDRKFSKMILLLGADHAGYVKRLQAIVSALTGGTKKIDIILTQMVKLLKNGESMKMSKRSGNFVTLQEVLHDLGKDILRFLMLSRKHDSQFEIDIDLAKEQSKDNPVFYVQYAHTRACSIIKKAQNMNIVSPSELSILEAGGTEGGSSVTDSAEGGSSVTDSADSDTYVTSEAGRSDTNNADISNAETTELQHNLDASEEQSPIIYNYFQNKSSKEDLDYSLLSHELEISIIKTISSFESIVESAEKTLEAHKIPYYLYDLATEFNSIWSHNKHETPYKFLIEDNPTLSRARLAIVYGVAKTLGKGLSLLGVTPMTEM